MRRFLLVIVVGLTACPSNKRHPPDEEQVAPKPAGPPRPLELEWTFDNIQQKFTVVGGGGNGDVMATESTVRLGLEKFDKGTKFEIGDSKGVVDSEYGESTTVDVKARLGSVLFDELEKVDTGLTLKLALPDGRQGEAKVPPIPFKFDIEKILAKVENGPVLFGTEPADPKPADSLAYVGGGLTVKIFGKAGQLQEIDFVATQARPEGDKGKKVCTGYTDNSGKAMPALTVVLKETQVTVWDRRTGEVVEKKTFGPDDECPMFTFRSAGDDEDDSYPPTEKIESWLKTRVKR